MLDFKTLPPEITQTQYNELAILEINHPKCRAKVALQGGHLFSWQPAHAKQDVLWTSEIEPFKKGNAIRGGIPVCFPFFGAGLDGTKSPSHGFARISEWQLESAESNAESVQLTLVLPQQNRLVARLKMTLGEQCEVAFTNWAIDDAQLALHSYFNLADIAQTEVANLPIRCFDQLTKSEQAVQNPRKIAENVDCIYAIEEPKTVILDHGNARQIEICHQNATEMVLWNPWHKATSGMSESGYQTMVCVETAKIYQPIALNETVGVKIVVK